MKITKVIAMAMAVLIGTFCMAGCGSSGHSNGSSDTEGSPKAVAPTGTYIGKDNDGISEFLGIRYGEFEPFKPAGELKTTSEDEIEAKEWGANCIQPKNDIELASQDPCSQDCLFLNVWTKDVDTTDKPVIFWIHGGSYIWGGGTDPLYDGEQFVRNLPEGEDCVFVTANYRMSFMGGCDLSLLEGYTDEYADAINLSKLDQTAALKWVNENIEAFGGASDNITIMGQSGGGGAVNMLVADEDSNKLFQRAIAQSGGLSYVVINEETSKETSQKVFDVLGVKTIEQLVSLTDEEIAGKITQVCDAAETGFRYTDGTVISKTYWDDWKNGSAKDIDLLLGSTNGEYDANAIDWDRSNSEAIRDYEILEKGLVEEEKAYANTYSKFYVMDQKDTVDGYLDKGKDKVKQIQTLSNDLSYTYPVQVIADAQSKYNNNVYVYYWEYAPDKEAVLKSQGDLAEVSPWGRALHSMDVCFVFGTLEEGYPELTGTVDDVDPDLMKKTQAAWYSFAKTGNPSCEEIGDWKQYNSDTRETMVITKDAEWKCVPAYRQDYLDLFHDLRPYGEK